MIFCIFIVYMLVITGQVKWDDQRSAELMHSVDSGSLGFMHMGIDGRSRSKQVILKFLEVHVVTAAAKIQPNALLHSKVHMNSNLHREITESWLVIEPAAAASMLKATIYESLLISNREKKRTEGTFLTIQCN